MLSTDLHAALKNRIKTGSQDIKQALINSMRDVRPDAIERTEAAYAREMVAAANTRQEKTR
jgi:hypothetical protein